MKFVLLSLLGIVSLNFQLSGQVDDNLTIQLKGRINGTGNSKIYVGLLDGYYQTPTIIDSFNCLDNHFDHQIRGMQRNNLYCIKDSNDQTAYFISDFEQIKISGNNFRTVRVTGSDANELLSDHRKRSWELTLKILPLLSQIEKAKSDKDTLLANKYQHQLDSLNQIQRESPDKFILENVNNYASAANLYLNLVGYRFSGKIGDMYAKLSKPVQECPIGKNIHNYIARMEKCGIGKPMQDFTLIDNNNKDRKLSSLKGNYFLIQFWASWCVGCRYELPYLLDAYNKYNSRGFNIISVSLDNSKDQWIKTLGTLKMPWPQVINKNPEAFKAHYAPFRSDVAKAYSVLSVPSNFLVNPDGIIIAVDLYASDLNKKLEEVYK
jgi:peroxiredoxin